MPQLPRDLPDLYFAPVALRVDARIEELSQLDEPELRQEVALASDAPEWTDALRRDALLRTVAHCVDLRDWELSWDDRGVRLRHDKHSIVLGVPESFHRYLTQPSAAIAAGSTQPAGRP